jgi:thiamine pyrophosphate-dependent acetolactate synthase large subunit-like protein/nitrite reductase/ring-hydroxylating ferredoxin subunit
MTDPTGPDAEPRLEWHRVADLGELPDGRVTTVAVGTRTYALANVGGEYGCLGNHCPHQGGPLGEGSIENGWLRCPWHGYDYDPLDGQPPEGFSDAPPCFRTEARDDGVYVELPVDPPRTRTVSDVMVETLVNWGIDSVFGMVGHSNLGLADALREAEARTDLRYFGIRHEGAASFAASAYGKLTGRPAACFGIAGPGSTNLLTGLYDARVDRVPVLALSGQVPSREVGRGAFQDLDLNAAFADVAVTTNTVLAGSDPAELVTLACKNALLQRGVAHLVVPDEVQNIPAGDTEAGSPTGRTGSPEISPPAADLDRAEAMIRGASRPLIVVGAGSRFDMDPIVGLAEQIGAPIVTTFKAKGQISDRHPLAAGVLGRSGTPVASWVMNESDLLVVFGASFSNHTGIASYKPTIQVDLDPLALGRFHPVELPLQGHVGVTASALSAALADHRSASDQAADLVSRWEIWRSEKASRRADDRGAGVNSAAIFESLGRLVDPDAVLSVDVGNNTYSFGRYFEVEAQSVLMSGYLGSIGFALPGALGAWAAVGGERQVVSVSGDGGFGQYAMELTTAVKYGMNITHVLLNNGELGKISKEQRAGAWEVWQTSLVNPSFAAFADQCGARGFLVETAADLDEALSAALAHDGPALVEVVTDAALL